MIEVLESVECISGHEHEITKDHGLVPYIIHTFEAMVMLVTIA